MATFIIVIILAVIAALAVKNSIKHFKGEGGCCGGGDVPKLKNKKLQGSIIAKKIIYIEGMHCENCKNKVEKNINQIDGAVAKVNLRKNTAVVSMDRNISDTDLIQAVEQANYTVIKIQ